jgi:putative flippase GtrA
MNTKYALLAIVISLMFMYVITQILTFLGIDTSVYGKYIGFYLFLLLCLLVLPTEIASLSDNTQ